MRRMIVCLLLCGLAPRALALDLVEAVRAAVEHDPAYAADVAAAEAGAEYARQGRAALGPRISLSGQYARVDTRITADLPAAARSLLAPTARGDVYGYAISLSQPLYRPDAMADARQLRAQSEIASLALRAASQDLVLRVAQAYFQVLAARDALDYTQTQRQAVAEQRAAAEARFDAGRARATDVAEAQARFDALEAQRIAAENDLASARHRLARYTGLEGVDPDALPAGDLGGNVASLGVWQERARSGAIEPLVRAAEYRSAAAEERRTRLASRPTIDLVARVEDTRQSGELSPLAYPERSRVVSAGMQFSVPVFASGALASRHRAACAREREAAARLDASQRDAELAVRDAHSHVTSGRQRVAALEQALTSARLSLEAGELGLGVGTRTNLDVLALREQAFDAERSLSAARYDLALSILQLHALAGALDDAALQAVVPVAALEHTPIEVVVLPAGERLSLAQSPR